MPPLCSCHLDFGTRSRVEIGPLLALTQLTSLVVIGQTWRRPDELRALTQLQVRSVLSYLLPILSR